LESFTFVVGACLGSFYNVVIHRLPRGESLVRPGSHCPACGAPIAPHDNIPLLSYLALLGKCRHCRATISPRYPLVEALSGALALLLLRRFGLEPRFFIDFAFASALLVVTFIDLDTYTIPDILSLSGILVGFAISFFTPGLAWWDSLAGIVVGGGSFWLIAIVYSFLRHREGLGGGDVKLLAMIGAFTGVTGVVFTVLAASVTGLLAGLVVMWRSRQGLTAMIPFGPFLALGALGHLFWGKAFFDWYLSTMR
jgi:leader peptidase (prepilin peptidase)/N-methyltransferase